MEAKNNIIRRALEQAPDTQLPEGFCERLMERLERESIAGLAWYFWYEPGVGLHLPDMPSFPDMPAFTGPGSLKFPEPDFPAESRRLSLFYVFIAATFLGLAGLDLYLRRRRHNVMKTNGHPHR